MKPAKAHTPDHDCNDETSDKSLTSSNEKELPQGGGSAASNLSSIRGPRGSTPHIKLDQVGNDQKSDRAGLGTEKSGLGGNIDIPCSRSPSDVWSTTSTIIANPQQTATPENHFASSMVLLKPVSFETVGIKLS